MTHLPTLQDRIARRRPGFALEQAFYTAPEIFAHDLERIFRRHWLLAGPSCRIRQPGQWCTYDLANDSVILVRVESGEIRAFHNVCRHRGSRICLTSDGHGSSFVCPYHAWAYDLDGKLKAARHLPEGVERTEFGMHPVAVRVVEGLIFVCLADEPPDFSAVAADLRMYLQPHGLHHTKVCRRTVENIRANWKVVAENFWECYHCAPAHPEFCSVMSYAQAANSERLARERADFEAAWIEETRRRGYLAGRVERSNGALHQGGRLPIRPGYLTQSRDGKPVAPLLGSYKEYDGGITSFMHLPLIWYVVSNDHALLTRFTPIAPLETELELTWLVHEDAVEGQDYDPENVCWLWRITAEQDKSICDNNQRGILSSRYQPGPYATTERSADEFVTWYLQELGAQNH
ncbi:MAG: aromatic ring-hydroxylating dioxygenase subunit alpha [Planctomycetes bacterium]|nr:aromatic ring-hydroxylating dioxygenase subunit alpha [Planctomycetota bacterium]